MDYSFLPTLNACLNTATFILLSIGYVQIRSGKKDLHKKFMLSAFLSSAVFLLSYIVYHLHVGSVRYQGTGWSRPLYFTILISHSILALFVLPMAVVSVWRALHGSFDRHKLLARKTLPLWLYVSITGVIVYVMLYKL